MERGILKSMQKWKKAKIFRSLWKMCKTDTSKCAALKPQNNDELCSYDMPSGIYTIDLDNTLNSPTTAEARELQDPTKNGMTYKLLKNIICLGLAFVITCVSIKGVNNFQTVNSDAIALITAYLAYMTSNVFLSAVIIRWLGYKMTLVVGILTCIPYVASPFYPSLNAIFLEALVAGVFAGPFWISMSTYLSKLATEYAEFTGFRKKLTMSASFIAFYLIYQVGQVVSNLISVLELPNGNATNSTDMMQHNYTADVCGSYFCPNKELCMNNLMNGVPYDDTMNVKTALHLVIIFVAAWLIILFLDPIKRKRDDDENPPTMLQNAFATLRLLKSKKLLMLLPATAWIGFQDGLLSSDVSTYVSSGPEMYHMGYLMIFFGVCEATPAIGIGVLNKTKALKHAKVATGVLLMLITGAILLWIPYPDNVSIYYAMSSLMNIVDGIFQAQNNALYALNFVGNEEAAYSCYRILEGIGYAVSYGYNRSHHTNEKLFIVSGVLAFGLTCCFVCNFLFKVPNVFKFLIIPEEIKESNCSTHSLDIDTDNGSEETVDE